mgnify:CR=1 FL=1
MALEEVATDIYRTEETRALDDEFRELLDLDREVVFGLGKLEYENVGLALLHRAREFGFFVGVRRDFLERESLMTQPTYDSMLSDYGHIAVAGSVNGMDIIVPTEKIFREKRTLPRNR